MRSDMIQYVLKEKNGHMSNRPRKRFALFGGTFDPFTPAHKAIVEALVDKRDTDGNYFFDEIWIMPTVVSYHRSGKTAWLNDKEKIDVINAMLATVNNGHFDCYMPEINIWEDDLKRKAFCKTPKETAAFVDSRRFVHTLFDFKAAMCHEDDEVHVVIGADSFANFKTWHMWEDILNQAVLDVVVGRGLDVAHIDIPHQLIAIDPKFEEMSGSLMREAYASRGAAEYIKMIESGTLNDKLLCRTPIFEVFQGQPVSEAKNLEPVKVKAPDWVTVIVEKDDELIVECQLRFGTMTKVEEFPCGMVEAGEAPSRAAVRELREEIGLVVSPEDLQYLGSMSPNPAFMTNHMHVFYFNANEASHPIEWTAQKLDAHENIEWEWRSKKVFIEDAFRKTKTWASNDVPGMMLAALAMYNNSGREIR